MKKLTLIILTVMLTISITACGGSGKSNSSDNEKKTINTIDSEKVSASNSTKVAEKPKVIQEYSFGPKVDVSTIPQETKNQLQDVVNKLGNPTKGKVDFSGFNAYYKEGKLYVELFVRNGTDKRIYNLNGRIKVKKGEEIIASANFTFSEDDFGVLEPNMSRVWTLVYSDDLLKVNNADLSKYILENDIRYNY